MEIFGFILSSTDVYLLGSAGTLTVIVIGAIVYRANATIIKKREQKSELINDILAPFNDAIVNIEHGEHNHIMILSVFHDRQREAVSRAKALAGKKNRAKIQAAWDALDALYQQVGEEKVIWQFATFPPDIEESNKSSLRNHIDTIVKAMKDI